MSVSETSRDITLLTGVMSRDVLNQCEKAASPVSILLVMLGMRTRLDVITW